MDVLFLGLTQASGAVGAAEHLFFWKDDVRGWKQSHNLTGGQTTENKQLSVEEQTSCLLSRTQSASQSRGQLLEQAAMKLWVNISFSPCVANWNESAILFCWLLTCCRWGLPLAKGTRRCNNKAPLKAESNRRRFICATAPRSIWR